MGTEKGSSKAKKEAAYHRRCKKLDEYLAIGVGRSLGVDLGKDVVADREVTWVLDDIMEAYAHGLITFVTMSRRVNDLQNLIDTVHNNFITSLDEISKRGYMQTPEAKAVKRAREKAHRKITKERSK